MRIFNLIRLVINNFIWKLSGNFSDIQKDYDLASHTYDDYYGTYLGQVTDAFEKKIPFLGHERVFELAAGTGRLTIAVRRRLQEASAHITAVDFSEGMLAINRNKNISVHGAPVTFYHGDAIEAIQRESDESLDAVLCAWGFCYLPHDTFQVEVERVLKPGGLLAIIEKRQSSLEEVNKLFYKIISSNPHYLKKYININLVKDSEYLVKTLCKGCLRELTRYDSTLDIPYKSSSDVKDYLLKSGISSGFLNALESCNRDKVLCDLGQLVAQDRVPLIHRFSALIARKG